jgi:hypothetical protein
MRYPAEVCELDLKNGERSRRRVRDLVTQLAFEGRSQNETERARISMMARSDLLHTRAGYRCARPTIAILKISLQRASVHTDGSLAAVEASTPRRPVYGLGAVRLGPSPAITTVLVESVERAQGSQPNRCNDKRQPTRSGPANSRRAARTGTWHPS